MRRDMMSQSYTTGLDQP
ncbi:hypothetical protein N026_23890 [Pseudomonas syringae UB303]|uniref:Uncharacterized protein n=1 Tax=Pseudomonas syringae UB303 TaxID=1357287 RepID=A0AAJ4BF15_PSESX|nr:hypothetical protein N026_23890 [Pseudomonas syringae UB303]